MFSVWRVFVSTHFLATPLGKKEWAIMANKMDGSEVDPRNIINADFGDAPEEDRKAFAAHICNIPN